MLGRFSVAAFIFKKCCVKTLMQQVRVLEDTRIFLSLKEYTIILLVEPQQFKTWVGHRLARIYETTDISASSVTGLQRWPDFEKVRREAPAIRSDRS